MMKLAICSLSSGSSGNCYVVLTGNTAVLVDAGISARQIGQRLEALGLGLDRVDAMLITHEHQDHVKGLPVIMKKTACPVLMAEGTGREMPCELPRETMRIAAGEEFLIGDLTVRSFSVSHDAAQPLGFTFSCEDKKLGIVTDTGCITDEIFENMAGCDILVLESNHDENILRIGRYPWFLKQRILGEKGHLSNDAAAEALANLIEYERAALGEERRRTVLLAHLSKENNFPEMALATVSNVLEERGIIAGKNTKIETLSRTETSPVYSV